MGRSPGAKGTDDTDDTTVMRGTVVSSVARDIERSHYLVVTAGEKPGQRIRLSNQPVVIGRAAPADWVLPDEEISRTHCRVHVALDQVLVADLESSNGTFIEGKRLTEGQALPIGARLQLGTHVIEHEWLTREEVEESQALGQDIEKASHYLQSMLPSPMKTGPVRCDWAFVPSARLGGDAFGYRALNERHTAIYIVDVSGHGAGAAMHAVSVLNILRRGALPVTDFHNPANVLETLNVMFDIQFHSGMSVTVWYGVFDSETRRLKYASAGHHGGFLVHSKRDRAIALETAAPEIGVKRRFAFRSASVAVPPQSSLYLFSDGAYEFARKNGSVGTLEDFASLLLLPTVPGKSEAQRLLTEIRSRSLNEAFEDDCALMAFTFA
jgi:serine phosphatase RsbU (regulator of sigma subunit)